MMTQQPAKKIPQQAQAPTAVKEPLWRVIVFCILGIALPLVAGSMVCWPWGVPDFVDSPWVLNLVILAALVSVAVGAFLLCFALRVWWVAVFATVARIVGEFLSVLVRTLVEGSSFQLQTWDPFWSVQLGLLFMVLMPLFLGMVIGAPGGLTLAKRRACRPQAPACEAILSSTCYLVMHPIHSHYDGGRLLLPEHK